MFVHKAVSMNHLRKVFFSFKQVVLELLNGFCVQSWTINEKVLKRCRINCHKVLASNINLKKKYFVSILCEKKSMISFYGQSSFIATQNDKLFVNAREIYHSESTTNVCGNSLFIIVYIYQ